MADLLLIYEIFLHNFNIFTAQSLRITDVEYLLRMSSFLYHVQKNKLKKCVFLSNHTADPLEAHHAEKLDGAIFLVNIFTWSVKSGQIRRKIISSKSILSNIGLCNWQNKQLELIHGINLNSVSSRDLKSPTFVSHIKLGWSKSTDFKSLIIV
jgi:hypothetical protein